MEKIFLKEGDKLEDKIYINKEIEITCEGNNYIKNCIFSNILNEKFITLNGSDIVLESNQFLEMKHKTFFVFYDVFNLTFYSNLFLKCDLKLEITIKNTIFHKNRFESSSGNINLNSFNNHFINNEIINNKDFEIVLKKKKNLICYNIFDYKSSKNSKGIIINSNDNLIKGNQFLNTEYPITFNDSDTNDIMDNDFLNSKILFTCNFENDGMLLNLNIENNNFVQNKKIFNKKKYTKSIHTHLNVENEELMKTLTDISNISEEMNKIKDLRLKRKIKEEIKKEEFVNDLNKKELIKILAIESKLNKILSLSQDLQTMVERMKKELYS